MNTKLEKTRITSLLNRDFRSLKRDLINYAQAYASGSFTDFNEVSPGMANLEFTAYVGDMLSWYIDNAFLESGDLATQLSNIQRNAKSRGYRPRGKSPARGKLAWAITVPATINPNGEVVPDDRFTPILQKGSQGTAQNGVTFETLEDVVFSASLGREVVPARIDSTTNLPSQFAIRRFVDCIAGRTVTETFSIQEFEQFKKIELGTPDVIEVIDVFDSQGNEWVEVEYLSNDWTFIPETNLNQDSDIVPYIIKIRTVPRRFIVDRDIVTGVSRLIFGSGDADSYSDQLVPDVANLALPLAGRRTIQIPSINPQNFLQTDSLGLSPHDTTLTVRYRVGGGTETNCPARTVDQVSSANLVFAFTDLNPVTVGAVEGSIGCLNIEPMSGGGPEESAIEIKLNAAAFFSSQDRMVTREDILSRVLHLPERCGKISKAFVSPSRDSRFSYDVHVLSSDQEGRLITAPESLKSNIITFFRPYRMMTDGINLLDAGILDLRVYFGVVISSQRNRASILVNCTNLLRDFFRTENMGISQPIIISQIVSILQGVSGVVSVFEVSFTNVFGITDSRTYSDDKFLISDHLSNGMLICPPGHIFHIRYPTVDIVGSAR